MWVIKYMENCYNKNDSKNIIENRAYAAKINITNESFGQTFFKCTGPKCNNSLSIDVKNV